MSSLFGGGRSQPQTAPIPPAPAPPTVDAAIQARDDSDQNLRRKRMGRAAAALAGGGAPLPDTAAKTLLGQ